ncbi:hypothetical protein ACTI_78390 [Actinoplanes sp. OR16]|nr:hypothetical protein ACTI_78390 [Actinoplanes sp. OR16]
MAQMPGLIPVVVLVLGGVLLLVECLVIRAIHHGRQPRRDRRRRNRRGGGRYNSVAVEPRKLVDDAYAYGSRPASDRLVDSC